MSIADLAFPEVDFGKPALKTVVCELRFNPLLIISRDTPVAFQEVVRASYPKVAAERGAFMEVRVTAPGAQNLGEISNLQQMQPEGLVWRFRTDDDAWVASLGIGLMSLETTAYTHFQDFWSRFRTLLEALKSVYAVESFVRIGLRYVNVFGGEDFPGGWRGRFNPRLLGPLTEDAFADSVKATAGVIGFSEDGWTLTLRHGTDQVGGYRIDLDHATTSNVAGNDVEPLIRAFNGRVYQVFRWTLSDSMYEEMEPHLRA